MDNLLPKSWDEVSLQQYIEIKEIIESNTSEFYKTVEFISILTGVDTEDETIQEMDVNLFTTMVSKLKWFSTQPPLDYDEVMFDMTCKDVNKLTLGEFIDLEYFFGNDFLVNLPKICAILYRKTKTDEWGNTITEPYDNIDIDERSKMFLKVPISSNYGIISYYLKFKEKFYNNYRHIFQIPDDDGELLEEDLEDPEVQADLKAEKVLSKWAWERLLHNLCGGDLTKYEEVTRLPLIFVFNQLSFKKELKL